MPLIPIIAWFKKWVGGVVLPYVEWADPIIVKLVSMDGLSVLLYNPTPTLSLITNSGIDVSLVQGNDISVKLMPSNPIDVVVDNNG